MEPRVCFNLACRSNFHHRREQLAGDIYGYLRKAGTIAHACKAGCLCLSSWKLELMNISSFIPQNGMNWQLLKVAHWTASSLQPIPARCLSLPLGSGLLEDHRSQHRPGRSKDIKIDHCFHCNRNSYCINITYKLGIMQLHFVTLLNKYALILRTFQLMSGEGLKYLCLEHI